MPMNRNLRRFALMAHGIFALTLGLAFLYLTAVMTNLLFQAIAIVIAVLLSSSALILAAFVDWFIAFNEGTRNLHRQIVYTLAGIVAALTGIFLCSYPNIPMQWSLIFASAHAFVIGVLGIAFAKNTNHHNLPHWALYAIGGISILVSGVIAALVRGMDDRSVIKVLGMYLCFVGAKMLLFAWSSHRVSREIGVRSLQQRKNSLLTAAKRSN
jgi:hypothetical protein